MIVRYPSVGASRYDAFSVCSSCLHTWSLSSKSVPRRTFTSTTSLKCAASIATSTTRARSRNNYFLDNAFLKAFDFEARTFFESKRNAATTASTVASIDASTRLSKNTQSTSTPQVELPHRRRQRLKQNGSDLPSETAMAPDMPSLMTTQAAQLPQNSVRRLYSTLLALSKPRLSALIVLTTTSAYSLYPVPEMLSPALTETPSLSALTLLFLTVGTSLTCASANALNMLYEPKWDALMSRTKNRPLVRGLISPRGAAIYAILAGAGGVLALYYGVNPTVAFLGGFNIFLYAGIYTPMKRFSVLNTWAGAIVGGIPPLMGWAAAAGQSSIGDGTWQDLLLGKQNIGGWLLAALLVAWQFPHFMALSWPIREEYKAAGYRMLAWVNPARNGRVALRYSLLFIPICLALCYTGVTEWSFAVASTPANVWILREAYKFWKLEGYKGSSRGLFWASVWHLPVVMVLAMVEKKGMWQRAWRAAFGEPLLEDDEEWVDEDVDEQAIEEVTFRPSSLHPVPVNGSLGSS